MRDPSPVTSEPRRFAVPLLLAATVVVVAAGWWLRRGPLGDLCREIVPPLPLVHAESLVVDPAPANVLVTVAQSVRSEAARPVTTLHGVVRSANGQPLVGWLVGLRRGVVGSGEAAVPEQVVATDAEGAFLFTGLEPDTYEAWLVAMPSLRFTGEVGGAGPELEPVPVQGELRLAAGFTAVTGLLTNRGLPDRSHWVRVLLAAGGEASSVTDDAGVFRVVVPPGAHTLRVVALHECVTQRDGLLHLCERPLFVGPGVAVLRFDVGFTATRFEVSLGRGGAPPIGSGITIRGRAAIGDVTASFRANLPPNASSAVFSELPPGTWVVGVTPELAAFPSQEVVVGDGVWQLRVDL